MNNSTSIPRSFLYTRSFKLTIRIGTPIYFSVSIISYSSMTLIESWLNILMLICMFFIWFDIDVTPFLHEVTSLYSIKIIRKEKHSYYLSDYFSSRRNDAYNRIIASYPIGHYVYVIKDASASGYYKIGRTIEPSSRLRKFGIALPFTIHIIAVISCDDEILLESTLHRQFSDKRVNGEWFALNGNDIEWIVKHYGLQI